MIFAEENIPHKKPPALVTCKTKTTCDHNPKHLEQFVADFYKWYVTSVNEELSFSKKTFSTKQLENRKKLHDQNEEHILKERLSPRFYVWRQKSFDNYGSAFSDNQYCSGDIDPITCSQDILNEWMYNATAQLIAMDAKNCRHSSELAHGTLLSIHPSPHISTNAANSGCLAYFRNDGSRR